MPRTSPWHFLGDEIYHNHTDCLAGQSADRARREGSAGRRLCPDCVQLGRGGGDGPQFSGSGPDPSRAQP